MIRPASVFWLFLLAFGLSSPGGVLAQAGSSCACDCDSSGTVTIDEVVAGVNIALGKEDMDLCEAADMQADGSVNVQELVTCVGALVNTFSSTWEGIQKTIFERHGCTEQICHGSNAEGELDLRADVAYESLIEVLSSQSSDDRVEPGEPDRSLLWLKLAVKTDPSQIPPGKQVPGSPMPQVGDALTPEELELVRLWIYNGAPETGTVAGTEGLLQACLPPPQPITIKPLDPPAPGEGIQFVMPEWTLEARSEHEVCFASYYDVSDQVPEQYKTADGQFFYFDAQELRQDPQSHHLILNRYMGPETDAHEFGEWACRGGEHDGQTCDPFDLDACGTGQCATAPVESFACIGFGPGLGIPGLGRSQIGGAQQAQSYTDFYPGVFGAIPVRGILIWNSHAFNLTDQDHKMNGRLNYYFADDRQFVVDSIFDASRIFAPNAPPYTTQTVCHTRELDQYTRLFSVSSHTHQRGKHFTVELPDGTLIYENFVYNDPLTARFDPPLEFDSPRRADRTLRFCSLYNNGVGPNGEPDPQTVTRASRVPPNAPPFSRCKPVACVEGKVGDPCNTDADCDTSLDAGDGWCDACAITGGESTENEMFILLGQFYLDPPN